MASFGIPPFYQSGKRITFDVHCGDHLDTITGEVMDTGEAWIAVKDDATNKVQWFNMDYLIRIAVLE